MKNKLFRWSALLLSLVIVLMFAACSGGNTQSTEASSAVQTDETQPQEMTSADISGQKNEATPIGLFLDRCKELIDESGSEPFDTVADHWNLIPLANDRSQYTSPDGTIKLCVIIDNATQTAQYASATVSVNDYADEKIRADMILAISEMTAAMQDGDVKTVSAFCSDFESVIESGVELFDGIVKCSLSANEANVTMSAEIIAEQ